MAPVHSSASHCHTGHARACHTPLPCRPPHPTRSSRLAVYFTRFPVFLAVSPVSAARTVGLLEHDSPACHPRFILSYQPGGWPTDTLSLRHASTSATVQHPSVLAFDPCVVSCPSLRSHPLQCCSECLPVHCTSTRHPTCQPACSLSGSPPHTACTVFTVRPLVQDCDANTAIEGFFIPISAAWNHPPGSAPPAEQTHTPHAQQPDDGATESLGPDNAEVVADSQSPEPRAPADLAGASTGHHNPELLLLTPRWPQQGPRHPL